MCDKLLLTNKGGGGEEGIPIKYSTYYRGRNYFSKATLSPFPPLENNLHNSFTSHSSYDSS